MPENKERVTCCASPFRIESLLAAQAEAGDDALVALFGSCAKVIEQLATAGNHLQETTTCAVVFRVGGKVLGKVIDTVRETNDLHVSATGVGIVKAEGLGILEGDLAHCCEVVPAHLADGGCCGDLVFWRGGVNHRYDRWQAKVQLVDNSFLNGTRVAG